MHKILSDNLDKIKELCNAHNVNSLFAFGSVCTDRLNDKSDIDLLISFKQMEHGDYADHYFTIAEKLEKILNRPVDLVTEASLGNPYFIESVNNICLILKSLLNL
ncbi:MAG: nucleotidyltransferase domain-containing protein [Desulfamplus sp.]|nr:nucleotidyltransferase domain-containing protein [Desulfamplus sp.]